VGEVTAADLEGVQAVKALDRAFVSHCDTDPRSAAIVKSTVELAHNLDMRMIAEGVENEEDCRLSVGDSEWLGDFEPARRLCSGAIREAADGNDGALQGSEQAECARRRRRVDP
jgi:predicted signal transduction protein with EAL and GGDEF domain